MKKRKPKHTDKCTKYALDVINSEVIAGPFARATCQRHLDDLDNAGKRGYYYDEFIANKAIAFFEEILHLSGGQWEGKPFLLLPWEDFIIASLFGWLRIPPNCTHIKRETKDIKENPWMWINNDTGEETKPLRRFRVAYIETAKGSGKSSIAGALD